jgi:hypothetical protein
MAVAEDDDAVAHGHRLRLVVGDEEDGRSHPGEEEFQLRPHADAERRVEVGERLVEEADRRRADDRPADGDALALAAGELARLALEERADLHQFGNLADPAGDLGLRLPLHPERKGEVAGDVQMRIEGIALEHHGDVALAGGKRRHVAPLDHHPPAGRPLEPGGDVEDRALAAARRPEQGDELLRRDRERHVVDGGDAAEALGDLLETDTRHLGPSLSLRRR